MVQGNIEGGDDFRLYLKEKQNFLSSRSKHEYILIMPGDEDRVESESNFKTYHVSSRFFSGAKMSRFSGRLDKIISILKMERPSVVELGSPFLLPYAGFYCQRHFASLLVGVYHADYPVTSIESAVGKIFPVHMSQSFRKVTESYARNIYNRFDMTLAVSRKLVKKLQRIGLERVRKLNLGVDLELFTPMRRDWEYRRSLGVGDEETLLIYSGRLSQDKRIDVLLDAFEMISEYFRGKLIITGDGPSRSSVIKTSQRMHKLEYFPVLSDRNKVARLLASADLYVTASPYENLGLSIIQAQACGLPVVGVATEVFQELVPDSAGVLGPVDSAHDLALNIMNLSAQDLRSKRHSVRQWAEENYSWEKTFSHQFRLYERLLRKKENRHQEV
jgi:glycosyltransferase involved in cell wall biosynthesis